MNQQCVCVSVNMCSRLLHDRCLFGARVHTRARAHTRHPSTSPGWLDDRSFAIFIPALLFLFLTQRGGQRYGRLSSRAHTRTRTHTPFPVLSFKAPPLSLSLFPKIATSRDQLVLERGRGVCALACACVRASVGLMYYCLESEEGLWIDTNSHPRQANPGAG